MELTEIKKEIDNIDDQIAELFKARIKAVESASKLNNTYNTAVCSSGYKRDTLYRVSDICGISLENYAKVLFGTIFDLSQSYQKSILIKNDSNLYYKINSAKASLTFPSRASVACQGVEGAYSQQACDKLFPFSKITYCRQFEGVFQSVDSGQCQYGLLPVENSSAGSVTAVYDLMNKYNFYIVKSIRLKIDHCLLAINGAKLENIREIVSHEQALAQCSEFLKANPSLKITVFTNTAAAAEYVSKSNRLDVAAIASPECAKLYNLNILSDCFQNSDHNYTRFICISKKMEIYPNSNKITFTATLPHEPGSLYNLISKIASQGINISKIESRPIAGKDFEFRFYFDIEASIESDSVKSVLIQLEHECNFVFLGAYTEIS